MLPKIIQNPHPIGCFWHDMAEKYGAPDIKYCEETICSVISEPANSWSNFGMIIIGILIFLKFSNKKAFLKTTGLYGLNMAVVGFFSFLYHLSNNFLTQYFDFLGMYSFFGLLLFAHLEFLGRIRPEKILSSFLISFIPFSIVFFILRGINLPVQISIGLVIVVCFITLIMTLRKATADYRYFYGALLFFVLAITSQLLDINRVACDPQNHWFQFHAMWHYLNAVGMAGLFFFYISLKRK